MVYFLVVFRRWFHEWHTTSSIFISCFQRRVPLLILFFKILQYSIMNRPWCLYCIFLNLHSVKFFTTLSGIFFRCFLVYFLKIYSTLILNTLEDLFAFFTVFLRRMNSLNYSCLFLGSRVAKIQDGHTMHSQSIISFFIGCFKDIYTMIILCTSVISFGLL